MTQTTTRDSAARRLGTAGVAVTVAATLTNALAYLVPVLGARHLSAGDLSTLATVLALSAIAGVPGLGLQIAVAVHGARYGRTPTARVTVATAALAGGAVVVAAPVIIPTLRLSVEVAALLAAMTVAVVLAGRWLGELQGDERFLRLATGMTVLAVGRYGGVIAGLALGAGLLGSLLTGVVVAYLALPLLAWLAWQRRVGVAATAHPPVRPAAPGYASVLGARQVMTASSATLAMLAVSYADLLLARQLLPPAESGAYAVGTVLTKGALWAPQVVTVLALPRLAVGDRRMRTAALAVVGACGAVLVVASTMAGELAFRLAGGEDYARLGEYAPFFAATGALYALVFVLVNAKIAAGARRPSAPLWAAAGGLAIVAVFVAPHTFEGIMWSALAAAAFASLAMVLSSLPATGRAGGGRSSRAGPAAAPRPPARGARPG
ncbi:polysaccharide biosynthesis protein [Micromonospora sp. DT47]|uniref:polysaccharide biosynthesis protein n=1 Tax=Micromonospora sp. DT47 TaxID=3393431 RepID=UPI003CEA296D